MVVRDYDFITGIETSVPPTSQDAVNPEDTANYGQIQEEFAKRQSWGDKVAGLTELKAIGSSDRYDGQLVFVKDAQKGYAFEDSSAATGDDDTVVVPNTGTGRWLKQFDASISGGGSGSSGASSVDTLIEKVEQEHYDIYTNPLDNSVYKSFNATETNYACNLLENYTSATTNIKLVVNPTHLDTTDTFTDSTTGWTLGGSSSTLTTSGTLKIGTASISFNKTAGSTTGFIQKTITTNPSSLLNNKNLYFWANLSTITNFSAVFVRIGTSAANYAQFNLPNDYSGTPVAVGWNLMHKDVSATPDATAGTSWNINSQSATYFAVGLTTTITGQTATVLIDAIFFADSTGFYANKGDELTIYDGTNKGTFIIDSANTTFNGSLTIAASMASSFTANSTTFIRRNTMTIGNDRAQATNGLTGVIADEQEVRIKRILHESLGGNVFKGFAQFDTQMFFYVTTVNPGVSIVVSSSTDFSAQFLTGHVLDVLQPIGNGDGSPSFVHRAGPYTLTGNSSFGSSSLTFPMTTTTGIAVGDLVIKRQINADISLASTTSNVAYSSMTRDRLAVTSIGLPYFSNIENYWPLGLATTVREVDVINNNHLPIIGTLGFTAGKVKINANNGITTSTNYFDNTTITNFDRDFSFAFWAAWTDAVTTQFICSAGILASAGFHVVTTASVGTVALTVSGVSTASVGTSLNDGLFHHIVVTYNNSSTTSSLYVDGALLATLVGNIANAAATDGLTLGTNANNPGTSILDGSAFEEASFYGKVLSADEVASLYNNGYGRRLGAVTGFRYLFSKSGLSGQKLDMKVSIDRETDADLLFLSGIGAIKT